MKKILSIGQSIINGRLHYGYPLSILAGSNNYLPWLYSNFIQLYCMTYDEIDDRQKKDGEYYYFDQIDFDFYSPHSTHNHWIMNNPFFDSECLNRSFLDQFELNLTDFLISMIEQDKYIYLFVDEYYLNKKHHYMHNIMIHGYDLESKCFFSSGYINGSYETYTIDFKILEKSFYPDIDFFPYPYNMLYVMRVKKDICYDFSLLQTCRLLSDYLFSSNTGNNYSLVHHRNHFNNVSFTYGVETYGVLLNLLGSPTDDSNKLDIRPFHTLKEHKNVMLSRLRFMEDNDMISSSHSQNYVEINRESEIIKSLIMKYSFNKSNSVLVNASIRLNRIREKEFGILEKVLGEIK